MSTIKQSIRAQYETALRQEQQMSGQVSGLKSGVLDLRNRSIQYNILQREVDTNRQLYDGLLQPGRLVSPDLLALATAPQVRAHCFACVLQLPMPCLCPSADSVMAAAAAAAARCGFALRPAPSVCAP